MTLGAWLTLILGEKVNALFELESTWAWFTVVLASSCSGIPRTFSFPLSSLDAILSAFLLTLRWLLRLVADRVHFPLGVEAFFEQGGDWGPLRSLRIFLGEFVSINPG